MPAGDNSLSLGALVFAGDEGPEPVITLAVGALDDVLAAAWRRGRPLGMWPTPVVGEVRGQALGRVLAHELGHYLLAWRDHRPDGLMRPTFSARDLVDTGRQGFRVDPIYLPRLRARLGGLARGTAPALAGSPALEAR